MKNKKQTYTCCICHKKFTGPGNNPEPIKSSGRCCDQCNKLVIKARIEKFVENLKF